MEKINVKNIYVGNCCAFSITSFAVVVVVCISLQFKDTYLGKL